jgi:hypothetical protein
LDPKYQVNSKDIETYMRSGILKEFSFRSLKAEDGRERKEGEIVAKRRFRDSGKRRRGEIL